jgi:hypothetical protein
VMTCQGYCGLYSASLWTTVTDLQQTALYSALRAVRAGQRRRCAARFLPGVAVAADRGVDGERRRQSSGGSKTVPTHVTPVGGWPRVTSDGMATTAMSSIPGTPPGTPP